MLFKLLLLLLPVQTVWPQIGPMLRPDFFVEYAPAATVTDYFFWLFFFFKDKPLCFQRGN
jgi:hypothetical protein